MAMITSLISKLAISVINLYQWCVSPLLVYFLGTRCRFDPSCSAYAKRAIMGHGPARGGWLTIKRLLCCHPWGTSGYDPVPPATTNSQPER